MTRLRVGVLGLSHDHVWANMAALRSGDLGRVVAVAEPDVRLRERAQREDGAVAALPSYDALLERSDLDGVLVFADNRTSADLGVKVLERGLPVMIEKPMAADLPGADALLRASRAAKAPLMVNWPTAWRPALRHGLVLARSGAVGEPVQLSHRGGHADHQRPGGPLRGRMLRRTGSAERSGADGQPRREDLPCGFSAGQGTGRSGLPRAQQHLCLRHSRRGPERTHRAMALMKHKRFDARLIHTHTFALDELPTALKYARERIDDAIKVVP